MSIPVPKLDDRSFPDLVAEALERIRQLDPEWTDLSVHDPGVVLVEAFAHLTDVLLYRLNRVPDRLYATFLNLLGTSVGPPGGADRRPGLQPHHCRSDPVRIPRGTRVTCPPGVPGAPQPMFVTLAEATIAAEARPRCWCARPTWCCTTPSRSGSATARPARASPCPRRRSWPGPGCAIGVQAPSAAAVPAGQAVVVDGLPFRIGREVDVFADGQPGELVYRLDRSAGQVIFGDGERGAVPEPGMAVRAWYRTGGGERGNVAPGQLTVLRDPIQGVAVTNPEPATGGHEAEQLAVALRRGPPGLPGARPGRDRPGLRGAGHPQRRGRPGQRRHPPRGLGLRRSRRGGGGAGAARAAATSGRRAG